MKFYWGNWKFLFFASPYDLCIALQCYCEISRSNNFLFESTEIAVSCKISHLVLERTTMIWDLCSRLVFFYSGDATSINSESILSIGLEYGEVANNFNQVLKKLSS